jgi:hypothetical protein
MKFDIHGTSYVNVFFVNFGLIYVSVPEYGSRFSVPGYGFKVAEHCIHQN